MSDKNARWSIPAIAAILYFSQGLPFGFVTETLNLYLAVLKVDLTDIGLLSGVGIIWTLKVFWAPIVDLFLSYRIWIAAALVTIAACIAALGTVTPTSTAFWVAVIVLVIASATQDIAIDALTIRITPRDMLGPVNSARVAAYRGAMLFASGGLAYLASRLGWPLAFTVAAALPLVVLAIIFATVKPQQADVVRQQSPFTALLGWLRRPGAISLIAVILLYRVGDSSLLPMIKPFWVAEGYGTNEIAQVTTTLAMAATIAGAIAGGAFVARFGVFSGLLWLGIAQLLSNFGYAYCALTSAPRPMMYGAAVIESFTTGLGTAAFLSFLMYICDRENAATEYAALTAIFGISRTLAGMFSGAFAKELGFGTYFLVTAALALPGLALLPLIRERVRGTPATIVTD